MFRKVILITTIIFSGNLMALDELSSLPDSHKRLIESVIKEFKLESPSQPAKTKIYNVFKYALEQENWYSYWIGNNDLKSIKTKNDSLKIYDMIIITKERVHNITFTYFKDSNQIMYAQKQYVEGSSSSALSIFKEKKAKKDMKVLKESDNYAFIQREGYVDFDIYHLKSPNGLAAYIGYGVIDL